MSIISDFVMGRSNKLARDFTIASFGIIALSLSAMTYVNHLVDNLRVAQRQQPIPAKVQVTQSRGNNEITTITRSVLDDPLMTGSITGRRVTLDPCSGQEKK